jgi:hypothetical protein
MAATVGDMMEAYAVDAVDFAREHFHYELDYSVESIERVEQILARFHEELPTGLGKALRRGPSDEQIEQQAKVWGGYLGEVIRRRWGGTWTIPADGPMANALCLDIDGTLISPPGKAYKRIIDGPEDNVSYYVAVLAQDLPDLRSSR